MDHNPFNFICANLCPISVSRVQILDGKKKKADGVNRPPSVRKGVILLDHKHLLNGKVAA